MTFKGSRSPPSNVVALPPPPNTVLSAVVNSNETAVRKYGGCGNAATKSGANIIALLGGLMQIGVFTRITSFSPMGSVLNGVLVPDVCQV